MKLRIISLLCLLVLGCDKEPEGFDTAAGKWTYTTPDQKIAVDFELVNGAAGWEIKNQSIVVDGTRYNAAMQFTSLEPPKLQFIRINANDAKAVYAYNIVFNDGVLDELNKQILVTTATYTWPHNSSINLKDIIILRQQ